MGFLSWLNRTAQEVSSPALVDRGFTRAERAAAKGAAATARVVGIERKLDDGTTKRYVAVAVGPRVSGIEIAHGPPAAVARLHLGAEVLVRADGDKAVLDWAAMGVSDEPAQKLRRKPPAEGVNDKAVDWGEQRRLKKWTPRRATIAAVSRRDSVLGPTQNYDVTLQLDDGGHAVAGNTEVPFYAAWFAAPGAEIPVAVDPKDPAKAVIDWAAAANEPNRPAGGLDDLPPAGSAAAVA
jgi:hypothetical protein